jgi:hypothetical protein
LPLNASLNLVLSNSNVPQSSVAFGTDIEGDGGGGADIVNGALAGLAPLLLDLLIELLEVLVCLVQQAPDGLTIFDVDAGNVEACEKVKDLVAPT